MPQSLLSLIPLAVEGVLACRRAVNHVPPQLDQRLLTPVNNNILAALQIKLCIYTMHTSSRSRSSQESIHERHDSRRKASNNSSRTTEDIADKTNILILPSKYRQNPKERRQSKRAPLMYPHAVPILHYIQPKRFRLGQTNAVFPNSLIRMEV